MEKPEYDDGGDELGSQELVYALPSTRFNISNEDELTQALEDSVKQILLQIQNLEASTSNLRFKKILSIPIHYDKYDPTRAGKYIELPEWIKLKKACINIKNKDQNASNIVFNPSSMTKLANTTQRKCFTITN